ncbi:MAG: tRNA pseudouridine(55) synthase TruB [Elusimicrobia bacterium]|nr:tRNA pseudouridine(55) synthase TruB [Elusimicrobiota bacterium]
MGMGLLLVDKPLGLTSYQIVEEVKKRLGKMRIGHCGSLDPAATGLLILAVGHATKWQNRIFELSKSYEGAFQLGLRTDTGDIDGKVLENQPIPPLSREALEECLRFFLGSHPQQAPAFSALKFRGKPLYYYARKGLRVPQKVRTVHIEEFLCLGWNSPYLQFSLKCSRGTYVRSLAEEVGGRLGCGATVHHLRRTRIGPFTVEQAIPFGRLKITRPQDIPQLFRPPWELS